MSIFKIVVFVPSSHANAVRKALAESGAGRIGNYDFCSFSSHGIGRFRPLKNANPAFGEIGILEEIEEERIETLVEETIISSVIEAVKKVHPYEEVVIDIMKLENF